MTFASTLAQKYSHSADFVKSTVTHIKKDEPLGPNEYIAVSQQEKFDSVLEYNEDTIGVRNFINEHTKNLSSRVVDYFISLFPILTWIHRYNLTWLYGDLIAGITVGIVAVPQAMSYAKLATLSPEYGLYSSFVGVFIYSFFATSKDVCIGPVAVMSLEVARTIMRVTEKHPEYADKGPEIAVTIALICGGISTGVGLLRLGFILEFIPLPAVMGFMTGSAFSIIIGQVPGLFGLAKRINTREATYKVFVNFWKNIGFTKVDVAFGLPALVILFALKFFCDYMTRRAPRYKIVWFYLSVLRNGIVIVVFTAISYACFKHSPKTTTVSLIKTVPSGLRNVGVPAITPGIVKALLPEIPVSVIILLLEHISIAKSFGRINNYKINPDQELIAIGVNNVLGIFFNAYPATGSFSRTALKAKCGVRTPIAGLFTGAVVLLALYALTGAFYWIPNATLSAIIIHAVFDLMVHPRVSWRLWKISPVEGVIFLAAVLITIFTTIEAGIYFSMCASAAFLLLRIAKVQGQFLGRVEYHVLIDPTVISKNGTISFDNKLAKAHSIRISQSQVRKEVISSSTEVHEDPHLVHHKDAITEHPATDASVSQYYQSSEKVSQQAQDKPAFYIKKYQWVPLSLRNLNPDLTVLPPPPGIIVFRPNESFIYPNSSRFVDAVLDEVRRTTRPGVPKANLKLGDRPWNDGGPRYLDPSKFAEDHRPRLRAVIFDMSASPYIDATGVQNLVDIKSAINRYSDSESVEYHFVGVISAWSRRALVAAGFGTGVPQVHAVSASERNIGSLPYRGLLAQNIGGNGGSNSGNGSESSGHYNSNNGITLFSTLDGVDETRPAEDDVEADFEKKGAASVSPSSTANRSHILVPLIGTNTPFFHFSMPDLDLFDKEFQSNEEETESLVTDESSVGETFVKSQAVEKIVSV